MKNILDRLGWKMAAWMEGRHGPDNLSNFLLITGAIVSFVSILPGLDLLWIIAAAMLVWGFFRTFSKNTASRQRENEQWLRISARPRQCLELLNKQWAGRATTKYFRCKGCGAILSVPKGKGKLRVTCPKCHWQTEKKS